MFVCLSGCLFACICLFVCLFACLFVCSFYVFVAFVVFFSLLCSFVFCLEGATHFDPPPLQQLLYGQREAGQRSVALRPVLSPLFVGAVFALLLHMFVRVLCVYRFWLLLL